MGGLARTRVTPKMLTAAGVMLCSGRLGARRLRVPERVFFFWAGSIVFVIGSILDILDGALARAGGR